MKFIGFTLRTKLISAFIVRFRVPAGVDSSIEIRECHMIEKKPLCSNRVRKINGSFAFIEHRFLRKGYWESLCHHELLLYLFLVTVSDRNGLSYYGYDKICKLLRISIEEYISARDALIDKDLIAFNGTLFQVLALPPHPVSRKLVKPVPSTDRRCGEGPLHIGDILSRYAGEVAHG